MSLILVTGATGAVGPLVVAACHDAGYSVRTLSLGSNPVGIWPEDVETRIGDVTDLSAVQAAMKGVDAVVHLAALLHIVNPPPALQEEYVRINVGGTKTVVAAAIQANVRRIVLFSTIAVYRASGERILTEDTPPNPDTFYARTKLDAERIVLEAKGLDGRQIGTVLRLGAVYGARVKGNYQRLVKSLSKGCFIPVGNGRNRRTLIYDKDMASAAVLALKHPCAAGKIFNVSDGKFHTLNDIISAICLALGRKPPSFSLPLAPVRMAAGIVEYAAGILSFRSPINSSTIDKYTEDVAVESKRIQQYLGFIPEYDLVSGWKKTVMEMRQSGEL